MTHNGSAFVQCFPILWLRDWVGAHSTAMCDWSAYATQQNIPLLCATGQHTLHNKTFHCYVRLVSIRYTTKHSTAMCDWSAYATQQNIQLLCATGQHTLHNKTFHCYVRLVSIRYTTKHSTAMCDWSAYATQQNTVRNYMHCTHTPSVVVWLESDMHLVFLSTRCRD